MADTKLTILDLGRCNYDAALELQRRLLAAVQQDGGLDGFVVLVEHDPPVITLGRRAKIENVLLSQEKLAEAGIELRRITRGGDVTYHGLGQLVAYPILKLGRRQLPACGEKPADAAALSSLTLRDYVWRLEEAVISTVGSFGIVARRQDGLHGVWTEGGKIAAVGVAVERWVTWHGLALNVATNMEHFGYIVPCGLAGRSVISMSRLLGKDVEMDAVKRKLVEQLAAVFGFKKVETTQSPQQRSS